MIRFTCSLALSSLAIASAVCSHVAKLTKKTDAIVVPVPLTIYFLQKKGTNLLLRYQTGGHPDQACAYLTAWEAIHVFRSDTF